MKRIVIACDGTWSRLDGQHPTNVAQLARAVAPHDARHAPQLVFYVDGVGSGRGTDTAACMSDRVFGGLFGQGLMTGVEAAYRFLALNFAPGDAVYLFGFSRGAYTARTLAGLIRNCGILERRHADAAPLAMNLYRSRDADCHPDGRAALAFRARYAAHVITSTTEADWRHKTLQSTGQGSQALRLAFLGIWDTVGALGLPGHHWLARTVNRRFAFHDTRLSRIVTAAHHAVAIDEHRRTFSPTLWDNLEKMNRGLHADIPRYQQRWFPGDHGSIGGGGTVAALSHDALLWIAEGAIAAGLALDASALAEWSGQRDCLGPLSSNHGGRSGLMNRLLSIREFDRGGPERPEDLAEAAVIRWRRDKTYRPETLARMAPWLDGRQPAQH